MLLAVATQIHPVPIHDRGGTHYRSYLVHHVPHHCSVFCSRLYHSPHHRRILGPDPLHCTQTALQLSYHVAHSLQLCFVGLVACCCIPFIYSLGPLCRVPTLVVLVFKISLSRDAMRTKCMHELAFGKNLIHKYSLDDMSGLVGFAVSAL